jgi:hypothetical protein
MTGYAPEGVRQPDAPPQWPFGTLAPTDEPAPQPQKPDLGDLPEALW